MPPKSVTNKRVLVTGAASGIGRATAVASARKGARLFLTDINDKLSHLDHTPAVVLFRYRSGNDVHEEPVFDIDAPWPDDAPIVRAHDLGRRNAEIFRYYAQRQPNRMFYLYDLKSSQLEPLGRASDLAARYPATAPAPP